MPRKQPYPHLKREFSRHGKEVWYHRVVGRLKTRLPGHPGISREAADAYYAAEESKPVVNTPGASRFAPDTFGDLCVRYLGSNKFLLRAPITQQTYRVQIEPLRVQLGQIPLKQFQPKHVVALMEQKAGKPGAANNILKMLKILFAYGGKSGLMTTNPAANVEKESYAPQGSETWRAEHEALFRAKWLLGSPQRTAFEIMVNTSLRIGDAVKMGPQHVKEDGKLHVRTGKTRAELTLPILPNLRLALDAAPTPHLTYLATAQGRTRSTKAAYSWFSDAAREAGLPAGYTAHGLRKDLLTTLAENGATDQQMMAVSGHKSSRQLQPYLQKARQKGLAEDALRPLHRGPPEHESGTFIGLPSRKVGQ